MCRDVERATSCTSHDERDVPYLVWMTLLLLDSFSDSHSRCCMIHATLSADSASRRYAFYPSMMARSYISQFLGDGVIDDDYKIETKNQKPKITSDSSKFAEIRSNRFDYISNWHFRIGERRNQMRTQLSNSTYENQNHESSTLFQTSLQAFPSFAI